MASFGAIHELAEIEIRVRRLLRDAQHELGCARNLIDGEELLSSEQHVQLKEMILRAMNAIARVAGD